MKYPILLLLALAFLDHSIAQSTASSSRTSAAPASDKKATGLSALKTNPIQLGNPRDSTSHFASLFHHFEVMDERPDTARIGIYSDGSTLGGFRTRQLIFTKPAALEISSYLDRRFAHPGAPYTALIVLRTLWLSNANNLREDMLKDPDKYDEKTKIRLKAEIYAEKDGLYTPVYRFDSLQVSLKSYYTHFGGELSEMLEDLADSATLLLGAKTEEGRKISKADIFQFNQSRFDLPVCRDSPLVKGVYTNIEEFRENAPSVQNYEIKKEKKGFLLYIKEPGGTTYYSRNAWGFCDGATVYIMKEGVLAPAWKEGKAWYLLSQAQVDPAGHLDDVVKGAVVNGIMPAPVMLGSRVASGTMENALHGGPGTQLHIFTLDMDTGQLY